MSAASLVFVKIQYSKSRWPLGRPQRWSWVAVNGENYHVLARSSESYTNRGDCTAAIEQLFGTTSNVYRREAEKGTVTLRMMTEPI